MPVSPCIIVLIGHMGAGKTTLGRKLAQVLGTKFIDLDAEIEKAAGCSIAEIFSKHGEAHFREGEHKVISRLMKEEACVLATGGGAWMDKRTRDLIRKTPHACTIWLHVPLTTLHARLTHSRAKRPLLREGNLHDTLKRLATKRHPLYAQADIVITFGDETVDEAVKKLTTALESVNPVQKVAVTLPSHHYEVIIGPNLLKKAAFYIRPHLKNKHAIIITDSNVAELHLATARDSFAESEIRLDVICVSPGEESKSFSTYQRVMEDVLALGIERGTTIIALGGGVVGDLAGFVAATAMRGINFIQIPTTLLSQVDSSVGGKTGINTKAGKNLVGAFWQPQIVLADISTLKTLPRRQLIAGYAEILKAGLISDPELFSWCEINGADLLDGNTAILTEAVKRACSFKAQIVCADEREQAHQGGRALLNLGHSFAHALEAEFHYDGRLLHGEAVSIGLHLALSLSVKMGLAQKDDLKRLDSHLKTLAMSSKISELPATLSAKTLLNHMAHDKKMRDGKLSFILLHGIGQAFTCRDVDQTLVRELYLEEGCVD
ncbi:3-dehydroquinate synthase [Aristophania vespae]|uniref:Multifunctional fusion protein n=1 Tax=Aristophania vespae TaxID=2697033 RepID=A0A6P1NI41_9PROT|nr:3-dehydroquinate synthase [Aristophania vespae]QHI95322.1 3-dehydroquinate synthase [Aristophania vespae]